jgi:TolB-like protein/DNA-binding winged helix-turn-helix (wHTH) protein/cytochrome c-type biogenesis protein CcmH/NrfG
LAEGRQVDGLASLDSFAFEGFRLDLTAGGLFRTNGSGVTEPVALSSRAVALLALLVEQHGRLVSKDDIFATAWSGTVVGENNLTVQISALRRVLDDARAGGSCIQTVAGRGYRFVLPVTRLGPEATPPAEGGASIVDEAHRLEPEAVKSPDRNRPAVPMFRRWNRAGVIAASALGLLLIAAIGWHSFLPQRIDATGSVPRLSIVVLPFKNLSNDPEQQYFVDGVTEDLTTDLSRIAGSFVISRNTAFTYKGKSVDAKQIGRELGVRYVLEGSVQRSGKRVRVNAQLIDAATDAHVWGERFERDIGDLFALQNEVTGRIANAFNLALINAEARRPTEQPDVMDYIFRGLAEWNKPASRETRDETIALFEHALAVDPHSAQAQSFLASAITSRAIDGMSTSEAADIARAEGLVEQALASSPNSALAHYAKAQVLRAKFQDLGMQNQCDAAIFEYETVLASYPNWTAALWGLASCKFYTGSIEDAVPLAEQTIRLSPHDPNIWFPYWQIGRTRLLQSRIDEAIGWLEKARSANPAIPYVRVLLASAYALKGETERAAAELAEARRLGGAPSSIAGAKTGPFGLPKIRALSETTFFAGLRKAGVPEE